MEFEVKKINEFKFFEPADFSISPEKRNLFCLERENLEGYLYEEAQKKAEEVDDICVVFIHEDDGFGSYVLGVSTDKKTVRRFLLFNAVECSENDSSDKVQTVVYDNGVCYWNKTVKYQKGNVI